MSKLLFTLYCIEYYAEHIGKSGKEAYSLMKNEELLCRLSDGFEYFRSVGTEHLMQYIDFFLERQERPNRRGSHASVRSLLVCDIVRSIAREYKTDEMKALDIFYSSEIALAFADDNTGLYQKPAIYTFDLIRKEYNKRI